MSRIIAIGLNVMDKYENLNIMYPGGNELNVAVYAKWQGHDSAFLGVFGDDLSANKIVEVLQENKIDISHSRFCKGENGYAMVNLVNGERIFGRTNNGGVTSIFPIHLSEDDMKYIMSFDIVSTSINSRLKLEEIRKIKSAGIPISYDFSDFFTDENLRAIAPYVDFSFLSCSERSWEESKISMKRAYEFGCPIVIATRGSEGSMLFDGKKFYHQEAKDVEVIDTMGAGDSFISAFLTHYVELLKNGVEKENAIINALEEGAKFASKICMVNGAIGYAMQLV